MQQPSICTVSLAVNVPVKRTTKIAWSQFEVCKFLRTQTKLMVNIQGSTGECFADKRSFNATNKRRAGCKTSKPVWKTGFTGNSNLSFFFFLSNGRKRRTLFEDFVRVRLVELRIAYGCSSFRIPIFIEPFALHTQPHTALAHWENVKQTDALCWIQPRRHIKSTWRFGLVYNESSVALLRKAANAKFVTEKRSVPRLFRENRLLIRVQIKNPGSRKKPRQWHFKKFYLTATLFIYKMFPSVEKVHHTAFITILWHRRSCFFSSIKYVQTNGVVNAKSV